MLDQSSVSGGFSILKGFSVFNPSELFVQTLKDRLGVKLDFLEPGSETVLWIGAPDFRYALLTMGGSAFLRFSTAFLLPFVLLIFDSSDVRARFFHVGMPILLILALFVFFVLCGSLVGSVYLITSHRVCIVFAERFPAYLVFFSRQIWFRYYKAVYFSFNYLQKIGMTSSKIYKISNLNFGESIGPNGQINNEAAKRSEKMKIELNSREIFLQKNICSAWNGFYAIRNAEEVSSLILKLSQEHDILGRSELWYDKSVKFKSPRTVKLSQR